MKARVQILPIDRPNANGRIYPRGVVEAALGKLGRHPLAVIPVKSFLTGAGVPKVADSLGVASDIAIDDKTNMLMATVQINIGPLDLQEAYVVTTAGFGEVVDNVVTEFSMSCIVLAPVENPK